MTSQPTLRRLATLENGAGFPHEEQGGSDGDYPFFKVGDFGDAGNERYLVASRNRVSSAVAARLRARPVSRGAILLPKIGAALLGNQRRITTEASVFDNNVLAVVPSRIEPLYLYYWLRIIDLGMFAKPGPVPSLDETSLLDLRVPISEIAQQRKIADFLVSCPLV